MFLQVCKLCCFCVRHKNVGRIWCTIHCTLYTLQDTEKPWCTIIHHKIYTLHSMSTSTRYIKSLCFFTIHCTIHCTLYTLTDTERPWCTIMHSQYTHNTLNNISIRFTPHTTHCGLCTQQECMMHYLPCQWMGRADHTCHTCKYKYTNTKIHKYIPDCLVLLDYGFSPYKCIPHQDHYVHLSPS